MPPYTKQSKFLSLLLRHSPELIGLHLDSAGWADIGELVEKASKHGHRLSAEMIARVVESSDKHRFTMSDDGKRIRANQGHSVPIDLGLQELEPPEYLYHGTAKRNISAIRAQGILRGKRQYVHLSLNGEIAAMVGKRHGTPAVLTVYAGRMCRDGFKFYLAINGVWMTEFVPPEYIDERIGGEIVAT